MIWLGTTEAFIRSCATFALACLGLFGHYLPNSEFQILLAGYHQRIQVTVASFYLLFIDLAVV